MTDAREPDVDDLPRTKFKPMSKRLEFCDHCGWRSYRHIGGWCPPDEDTDEDEDWN